MARRLDSRRGMGCSSPPSLRSPSVVLSGGWQHPSNEASIPESLGERELGSHNLTLDYPWTRDMIYDLHSHRIMYNETEVPPPSKIRVLLGREKECCEVKKVLRMLLQK